MIICDSNKTNSHQIASKMAQNLEAILMSIFKYSGNKTPLHFIIITDETTIVMIQKTMKDTVGKFLSEQVYYSLWYNFPRILVEFARLDSITEKYWRKIDDMKKLFGNNDPEEISEQRENVIYKTNNKYNHDLYYIALFYHVGLPEEIEKLIALDIDLRFR